MIIPGPQLLHQLNAIPTSEDDNGLFSPPEIEQIEDQPDEQSSSSVPEGNNSIDDSLGRRGAILEEASITQQGIKLRISPLYRVYYGTTLIIDLVFLGLVLNRFQINRSGSIGMIGYCPSNSSWAISSCSDIIVSLILLVLVGVSLSLLHNPFICISANLALAQDKSDLSNPNYDAMSNLQKDILSVLGSIHAPFPSKLYNKESLDHGDDINASNSSGTTGTNTLSNKFNCSHVESCRRLVQAIAQLVVHIDSAIHALQMATGLKLGIGVTSLAVYRVEQSLLHRLADGSLKPSVRQDFFCVERLKKTLFRIMVDTINHLENINVSLLERDVIKKVNEDTDISDQSSTLKKLSELNRVVETSESTPLSLSLLKSCRRQIASSLSRFTTHYLLSRGLESSPSSVSSKIRNLIQLATDGTEYLYHALFPYASSTSQQQNEITTQGPCRRKSCANLEIFQILIKLDAARTLLWCIPTINLEDKESSVFPESTQTETERLLQSRNYMVEALSLTKCLLERKGKGGPMNKQQCKEANDCSTTKSSLRNTECEHFGREMQVFEAGCLSQERDGIITDSTANSQSATLVYSGRGERNFNRQPSSSVREPSKPTITSSSVDKETKVIAQEKMIIMAPENSATDFIGELQNRLLELGLPEEGQKPVAAEEDAVSFTSSATSAGRISPLLPLTASSNLFLEIKEFHKLMLDKGDLIPQEPC